MPLQVVIWVDEGVGAKVKPDHCRYLAMIELHKTDSLIRVSPYEPIRVLLREYLTVFTIFPILYCPKTQHLAYRGYRGISCTTLRPGTTLSTATPRISWTEPIMRRDVTTIYTGIRRKSDKGAVSGRSVSHQCVGLYQYTETLGYGDSQLPRAC